MLCTATVQHIWDGSSTNHKTETAQLSNTKSMSFEKKNHKPTPHDWLSSLQLSLQIVSSLKSLPISRDACGEECQTMLLYDTHSFSYTPIAQRSAHL